MRVILLLLVAVFVGTVTRGEFEDRSKDTEAARGSLDMDSLLGPLEQKLKLFEEFQSRRKPRIRKELELMQKQSSEMTDAELRELVHLLRTRLVDLQQRVSQLEARTSLRIVPLSHH